MKRQSNNWVVHWEEEGLKDSAIRIEMIDHFDARGKRRVYGRGDHFTGLTLNMDVWRSRNRRLLARFWSRNVDVDWCSYEIFGLENATLEQSGGRDLSELWVPALLRDAYENWVLSEMRTPLSEIYGTTPR